MAGARGFGLPSSPQERRLVLTLSATSLLLWVGASAILPLLPAYLRAHGSSAGLVGLIMAAYYAASVLTQYPAGRIADRVGTRAVIAGGLVLFAGASAGFALATAPAAAIGFRGLEGMGAGAVTVASAGAIGALVRPEERGGAFGALYGSQMLALALGPLAGSMVGANSMRALFLGACGFALAALVPVLGVLRGGGVTSAASEPGREGEGAAGATGSARRGRRVGHTGGGPGRLRAGGALLGVAIVFASEGLLGGVYETCWTLLLRLRGASAFEIGLSWTLFAMPFAVLSVPAGRIAQRSNRRLLALGALASSAGFCALYPFLHQVDLLVGLGVVEAIGAVVGSPPAVLVLAEAVPPERQGAGQGVVETARTAATAVAAAVSGGLFGVAVALPFALAALVVAGACVAVWIAWGKLPARRAGARTGEVPLLLSLEQAAGAPESPARGAWGGDGRAPGAGTAGREGEGSR